jgi:hypothetical protein
MITGVVVPVTASVVVVVVVDEVEDVDDVDEVELDDDDAAPKARKPLIIALSSVQAGRRMSAPL